MGALNKVSDKQLRNLYGKPQEKQKMVADGNGLSVRVSRSGNVSFIFFFRLGGRSSSPIWLTLGRYPDLPLKVAREKRDQCRTWLAEGKDPRIYLNLHTEETLKPVTVKDALVYWIENYAKLNREAWYRSEERFTRYIYPVIGDVPLSECTAQLWIKCFDKIKAKAPVSSGHTFRDIKQAMRFCRVRRYAEHRVLDDFTVNDMGKKEGKRDRVLKKGELADLWKCVNISMRNKLISPEIRYILIIAIVFGCRCSEVRESTWDEWDFKEWIWIVPKSNSKNNKEIIRPIPELIRPWLLALKESTKSSDYVTGEKITQSNVSATVCRLWRKMGHKESWSIHDMRRVFATNLSNMGVPIHVVEQLLGHTMPGVMGIYNRSQYLPEKLEALNNWVNYLNSLLIENGIEQ